MKPTERLAETTAPDGTRLVLLRHDGAYFLRADGVELMSTRRSHSEVQLAEIACAPVSRRPGARVLVGGLGFGFTLRTALRLLGADATVGVAELLPDVIAWNEHPEWGAALAGDALRDPRVQLQCGDVRDVLREHPGTFDAIMLDVDNGAEPFTTRENAALYGEAGLRATVAALRPGGVVAWWSATDDRRFEAAARRAGLTVTTHRRRVHATAKAWHVIIEGRREDGG